jgi:ketosteroid isomerase-like protein
MLALKRPSPATPAQAPGIALSGPGPAFRLPTIDEARARETWDFTDRFFRAIQARAADEVAKAYTPDALFDAPIIGHVEGREIGELWRAFFWHTQAFTLDFTITGAEGNKAFVEWSTEHRFCEKGRHVQLQGASALTLQSGRIRFHHTMFDRHRWSAQALGLSGYVLSYLPGSKAFFRDEIRRAFGLDAGSA